MSDSSDTHRSSADSDGEDFEGAYARALSGDEGAATYMRDVFERVLAAHPASSNLEIWVHAQIHLARLAPLRTDRSQEMGISEAITRLEQAARVAIAVPLEEIAFRSLCMLAGYLVTRSERSGETGDLLKSKAALDEAAHIEVSSDLGALWADAQLTVAQALKVKSDQGDEEARRQGIAAIKSVLPIISRQQLGSYGFAHHTLAQLLARDPNHPDEFDEGIDSYHLAAKALQAPEHVLERARIHASLGFAYLARQRGNPSQNIDDAIAALDLALLTYQSQLPASASLCAAQQLNLASAYRRRRRGKRIDNLKTARDTLQTALTLVDADNPLRDQAVEVLAIVSEELADEESGSLVAVLERAVPIWSKNGSIIDFERTVLRVPSETSHFSTSPFTRMVWRNIRRDVRREFLYRVRPDLRGYTAAAREYNAYFLERRKEAEASHRTAVDILRGTYEAGRPYALYFRSFQQEVRTFRTRKPGRIIERETRWQIPIEKSRALRDFLLTTVQPALPVVCVSDPEYSLAHSRPGLPELALPVDGWDHSVRQLITGSRIIVVGLSSASEGVVRELALIRSLGRERDSLVVVTDAASPEASPIHSVDFAKGLALALQELMAPSKPVELDMSLVEGFPNVVAERHLTEADLSNLLESDHSPQETA